MEKEKKKRRRKDGVFRIGILILICCFGILGYIPEKSKKDVSGICDIHDGWYYLDEGEKVYLTMPAEVKMDADLNLYHDTLLTENMDKIMIVKGAMYHLKMYAGDQLIYQYQNEPFVRNTQMESKLYSDVNINKNMKGQVLCLSFENTENGVYHLGNVRVGSGKDILLYYIKCDGFTMIAVIGMVLLSILSGLIGFYLKKKNIRELRFLYIALFLFLCGIWSATDSFLAQYLKDRSRIVNEISFLAFMMLSVPMICFVKNTISRCKTAGLDILENLFCLNCICQIILSYFQVFQLVQMLFVTHILMMAGVVYISILLYREQAAETDPEKKKEVRMTLAAFLMVGSSGIFALILYWLLEISYYEIIYEAGVLIFIIVILKGLLDFIAEMISCRMEMEVYEKLKLEDRLTGMQNEKAFQQDLIRISQMASELENAILIFVDLNHLKKTNDQYGCRAGDEMIISTALLIKKILSGLGNCYRIAGNEFACVIINPQYSIEDIFDMFDREIAEYNRVSNQRVSISKGASYLKNDKNQAKSISDWKFEADMELYRRNVTIHDHCPARCFHAFMHENPETYKQKSHCRRQF